MLTCPASYPVAWAVQPLVLLSDLLLMAVGLHCGVHIFFFLFLVISFDFQGQKRRPTRGSVKVVISYSEKSIVFISVHCFMMLLLWKTDIRFPLYCVCNLILMCHWVKCFYLVIREYSISLCTPQCSLCIVLLSYTYVALTQYHRTNCFSASPCWCRVTLNRTTSTSSILWACDSRGLIYKPSVRTNGLEQHEYHFPHKCSALKR